MLQATDRLEKTKSKMLALSGISLFISLTEILPDRVTALGLDFSGRETVFGWFIFSLSLYFSIRFILLSAVELIKYYLPDLVSIKTSKSTGDTIGLTAGECLENGNIDDYEVGTISGEIYEINKKNASLRRTYKGRFIQFSNFITLTFEFVGPVVFSITSLVLLCRFLT